MKTNLFSEQFGQQQPTGRVKFSGFSWEFEEKQVGGSSDILAGGKCDNDLLFLGNLMGNMQIICRQRRLFKNAEIP